MDEPSQSVADEKPAPSSNGEKSTKDDDVENRNAKKPKGDSSRFRYGNFNRYYGTRVKGLERDPRLDLLQSDWFQNRAVLDIGCNVGAVTLTVAKEFGPRRVLGIDIDTNLIGIARKNIRHYCDERAELMGKFPASLVQSKSGTNNQLRKFPHNVWFQHENYVLTEDYLLDMVRPEFDIIMALSITKWIHLNWGDAGIRRFFQRVYRQLQPGGRFILEPQEFSTYGRRSKLTEDMAKTYREIQFKPDQFQEYLLSEEVGFESVEELGIPQAKSKGFERPIFVYRKAVVRESEKNGTRKKPNRKKKKRKTKEQSGEESTSKAPKINVESNDGPESNQ